MKTETTERRDFLKTLVKAGLACAATAVLATQAEAANTVNKNPRQSKPSPKPKK